MERRMDISLGPDAGGRGVPTKGSGRIAAAIIGAATLGFGIPYAISQMPEGTSSEESTGSVQAMANAMIATVGAIVIIAGVAAAVIGAAPGGKHKTGLLVLVIALTGAIVLGVSAGYPDSDADGFGSVVLVLAPVTLGSLIGYLLGSTGRSPR